ncbi:MULTISPECIES: serine hydrolase domain-containing protein [unclassified Arthrobacter]|uniref:serine hydrolase domain-containing protein n=1 Tax=unclassified Arthrobacter TaxID=235627 RepID=UPI002E08E17A|nr:MULTISPECIES: serine hydrolase domain-containing protein [unclassified Arthrobacter]MEC5191387.1 CubicO group peptidase (beta-lactamase class C family) [Arthrobacter sp. MP_M4]MEC5202862.1 CubicO group peptidase (beta-lactamase class C family) [Arthrobacter sp. MP_M7]
MELPPAPHAAAAGPGLSVGTAAPEFAAVRELFDTFLALDRQYSAQLAVYRHGSKVLDLSGGPGLGPGDITGTYSCSKGIAGLVIAVLVQDGVLDLDATVASYWPEFGVHGKERLTVRQALSHQAGVPGIAGGLALEEFPTPEAARRVAAAAPLWRPGSAFGYHALTMGILMEELCRRVAGRSLQELYDDRLRRPFGIDFFLGLPAEEEPRFREVLYSQDPAAGLLDPLSLAGLTSNAPVSDILELPNHRMIRAGGMSSAGGIGSADGLARAYAAATTGVDGLPAFLVPATIAMMAEEQVWGLDRCSGKDNAFAVVFMKPQPGRDFGSYLAFGHEGANAALGYADPGYGIGFGYVPRRSEEGRTEGRAQRLSAAVRKACAASG